MVIQKIWTPLHRNRNRQTDRQTDRQTLLTAFPSHLMQSVIHIIVSSVINKQHTECNHGHKQDLNSTAKKQGQQHAVAWRTKHVAVDQLPTKLLLGILLESHHGSVFCTTSTLISVYTSFSAQHAHQFIFIATACSVADNKTGRHGPTSNQTPPGHPPTITTCSVFCTTSILISDYTSFSAQHAHTHNHFMALFDFVRHYVGEPAPEGKTRKVKPISI